MLPHVAERRVAVKYLPQVWNVTKGAQTHDIKTEKANS